MASDKSDRKKNIGKFFGDTLRKLIFHQFCKISKFYSRNLFQILFRFYSKLEFLKEILKRLRWQDKSNCVPQFYAIESHQANKQYSLTIKIENILQKFSCISFLYWFPQADHGLLQHPRWSPRSASGSSYLNYNYDISQPGFFFLIQLLSVYFKYTLFSSFEITDCSLFEKLTMKTMTKNNRVI